MAERRPQRSEPNQELQRAAAVAAAAFSLCSRQQRERKEEQNIQGQEGGPPEQDTETSLFVGVATQTEPPLWRGLLRLLRGGAPPQTL